MIEVKGLTKWFGAVEALRGVDLAVGAGEVFGFVGPNGAGKTTTLRILAGLASPSSGAVTVDGVDVATRPERVRDRIGYMPDFFGVYDRLTAGEYLAFYASCHRLPRARTAQVVGDLLELVRLSDKRQAPVDTLSRGMKQRLCLARSLVHDPSVLLLDEPASGLDPRARAEMRDLVAELQGMGKTILVSSHILPELAEMCSTFGVIDSGRMVASGSMSELAGAVTGRRARARVLGDPAEAARRARDLPGVVTARAQGEAVELDYDGDDRATAALLSALVGAGVGVVSFATEEADLEDVFLRITGQGSGE
ncbi:MAG: ATP-binding cassette domain-containing protein [Acidimicrobiales bacterium]